MARRFGAERRLVRNGQSGAKVQRGGLGVADPECEIADAHLNGAFHRSVAELRDKHCELGKLLPCIVDETELDLRAQLISDSVSQQALGADRTPVAATSICSRREW